MLCGSRCGLPRAETLAPGRPWKVSEGGRARLGDTSRARPEGTAQTASARSLCSQLGRAAFTHCLARCPLVFFHLCPGPQLVAEGMLMMGKSHCSLTVDH